MLYYHRIDISQGTDLTKSNNSKECMVCHYSYFFHGFKFQNSVCGGCHDLMVLCPSLREAAIITIKGVDYCCVIKSLANLKQLIS